MEYYMFAHFGPNTFTDVEWGDGTEDPRVFNPTGLDCRQWAETAKKAGMKGIIITAKHHDGFCLWGSQYSTHTVRTSTWKNGQGDVLRELSDACREAGLKFGVYLSPWDRNHPAYGTPAYNRIFADMLTEVLTSYGDVFEQWFDGANGEGENGKKQIYDWPLFNRTVYEHQPHAVIFSDVGPGCRWIGNELGRAGQTCWSRLDAAGFGPGSEAPAADTLNSGNVFGAAWIPGETDVSIRPGWFYSPATDDKVKSLDHLLDIYYTSVGRNTNLLLNVPPDRRGRIHPNDSTRLMELRERLDAIFKASLLSGAKVAAGATRGNAPQFSAEHVLDDSFDTYWATDDTVTTAALVFDLPQKQTFNLILLQEYIPLGQRVAAFSVEYWDDEAASWELLATATTIGYKRILRLPATTAAKIRVNILRSLACPTLSTVGLYNDE
jgi:alpha-L-fucosidase